ncbi:MAG: hypothetical protein N2C14_31865, partial [Planctomycetales bacterium]
MFRQGAICSALLAFTTLCGCGGCGSDTPAPVTKPAPTQVRRTPIRRTPVAPTVQDTTPIVNISGNISLQVRGNLVTKGCYARLAVFPGSKRSMLRITSY